MKQKRGQSLPMNAIVIALLVLVVLVVLILIYTGSMGKWLQNLNETTAGKRCEDYHGATTSHEGHWVDGTACPGNEVPIYNVNDADTHPGQTCCLDKT
ncbi:MAG: hypothetical protein PHV16_03495 [Candidatus Nanoarchaeia archaeon]|nr:hypothetical protein [Candidatus Nanoarchaeia archaeon]